MPLPMLTYTQTPTILIRFYGSLLLPLLDIPTPFYLSQFHIKK